MRRLLTTALLVLLSPGIVVALDDATADRIRAAADELYPSLVECRRWFHAHPELSNREAATGAEIARRLRAMGYEPRTGVAGHGVVAVLEGGRPGPVVAWRSDIDALPIEEAVDVPWRSQNPGVMHACGHDVHTTVGLGVAELLMGMRDEVPGTVVFLFQPAEEGAPPGEEGGATLVLAEGALDDPRPEAIFGLHVMPNHEVGTAAWGSGPFMASADRFSITVTGRMTHGSAPQDGIDAVWVGAQVVAALQGIVAREIDSRSPVVVSVGTFDAGSRFNIIAGSAELTGTVRTLDAAAQDHVEAAMRRVVEGVCAAHRASCEVQYDRVTPMVVNDPELARSAVAALRGLLGDDAVFEVDPIMAAEDFAEYARVLPGFFFFLGVGNEAEGWTSYVHTPTFRPDEEALRVGVRAVSTLLLDFLDRR
ncbi:MAG TPA: M20 family metallopeptidase [Candidatus Sulfomarinibacteraceae bacterium]|nr:M20 family metallopeptidase [Candidatus Sulfomarinibacteraceae bacterium]